MTYAGWDLTYRAFQQNLYTAVGGETTIPNKGIPESVLYKDGKLLNPTIDYSINYTTGVVTLTVAAKAGEQYQLLNLSTFHMADTYTKDEVDKTILISSFYTASPSNPVNLIGNEPALVEVDCTNGSTAVMLPTNPKTGLIHRIRDKGNTITLNKKLMIKRTVSNSRIMGLVEDMDVTTPNCSFSLVWNGSEWRVF